VSIKQRTLMKLHGHRSRYFVPESPSKKPKNVGAAMLKLVGLGSSTR
jgi:hypothetical protein